MDGLTGTVGHIGVGPVAANLAGRMDSRLCRPTPALRFCCTLAAASYIGFEPTISVLEKNITFKLI